MSNYFSPDKTLQCYQRRIEAAYGCTISTVRLSDTELHTLTVKQNLKGEIVETGSALQFPKPALPRRDSFYFLASGYRPIKEHEFDRAFCDVLNFQCDGVTVEPEIKHKPAILRETAALPVNENLTAAGYGSC